MKNLIKDWTPPIMWRFFRERYLSRSNMPLEWEYISRTWEESLAKVEVRGWNVEEVLSVYKSKWDDWTNIYKEPNVISIKPGTINIGLDDLVYHNSVMCYSFALAYISHLKKSITMLDWGGGLGHYYLISKALMPELIIDYSCADLPILANYGQKLLPVGRFYSDDSCLKRQYDFILSSGSLHYSDEWKELLNELADATSGYLFITRLPTSVNAESYVFIQRPYHSGYDTEFLGWCLNRNELLNQANKSGLTLVREFFTGEQPKIHQSPEQCIFRGFLFRSNRLIQ